MSRHIQGRFVITHATENPLFLEKYNTNGKNKVISMENNSKLTCVLERIIPLDLFLDIHTIKVNKTQKSIHSVYRQKYN